MGQPSRTKITYCGKENIPLQIEHIVPRAKGGSNRVSNLCLACEKCNLAKGTKDIADFLVAKPDVLKRILAQAKAPRHDAAAVNTTRRELNIRLEALGLPIECGSGGLTKYNRSTRELPKTHWLDAAFPPNPLEGDGYPCRNFDDYGLGCIQAIEISWIELGGNQE